jgi:Uma2 family endonuclease
MPQIVEAAPREREPAPNRIRWTRAQCTAIQDAGVLTGRYELIDGEIISKMGHNPPHATALGLVFGWLAGVFGVQFIRVQTTADAGGADRDHNEPEPDVCVTRQPPRAYSARHPGPEDLLLVVEVSDTTLRFDRTTKAALYAASGIQDYWVLDVRGRRLFVHRRPEGDNYAEITEYGPEESAAPLARPEAAVVVSDLLP